MPDQATQLVEYGIRNNPDNWKLYYELGFIYYMDTKDYERAADAFLRGSKTPNAHPFLKVMAAQMAQHAGDTQMARALWTTTYQSSQEKQIRGNAVAHLRALQIADDVTASPQTEPVEPRGERLRRHGHRTGLYAAGRETTAKCEASRMCG